VQVSILSYLYDKTVLLNGAEDYFLHKRFKIKRRNSALFMFYSIFVTVNKIRPK